MTLAKRIATTTLLGLSLVAASAQQAAALTIICLGARFIGAGIDEYGYYEDWECTGGIIIY